MEISTSSVEIMVHCNNSLQSISKVSKTVLAAASVQQLCTSTTSSSGSAEVDCASYSLSCDARIMFIPPISSTVDGCVYMYMARSECGGVAYYGGLPRGHTGLHCNLYNACSFHDTAMNSYRHDGRNKLNFSPFQRFSFMR